MSSTDSEISDTASSGQEIVEETTASSSISDEAPSNLQIPMTYDNDITRIFQYTLYPDAWRYLLQKVGLIPSETDATKETEDPKEAEEESAYLSNADELIQQSSSDSDNSVTDPDWMPGKKTVRKSKK